MKPISINEIYSLSKAKQNFCDCYLVSSINALTGTINGRKILSQNIQKEGSDFCIRFNNVNGKLERYLVKGKECDDLIMTDKFLEEIPLEIPHHPIIKAIEIAMNKLISLHPDKKPLISRIPSCKEKFEYNKVSNFLTLFTGIRPITLNESGIRMSLQKNKDAVEYLMKRIESEKDISFVIGSGYRGILSDLPHCWTIKGVSDKKLNLFDNKKQANISYTFDSAIKRFKFICGYFNDMLG